MAKKFPGCICSNWCRVEHTPEQMKSNHHKDCEAHNRDIDVVCITDHPCGNKCYDSDIKSALLGLMPEDGWNDGEQYIVTFNQMPEATYDDLPEFQGF